MMWINDKVELLLRVTTQSYMMRLTGSRASWSSLTSWSFRFAGSISQLPPQDGRKINQMVKQEVCKLLLLYIFLTLQTIHHRSMSTLLLSTVICGLLWWKVKTFLKSNVFFAAFKLIFQTQPSCGVFSNTCRMGSVCVVSLVYKLSVRSAQMLNLFLESLGSEPKEAVLSLLLPYLHHLAQPWIIPSPRDWPAAHC